MNATQEQPRLGLRANLTQFCLLVAVNALVGGMVGQEQSVLPLLARQRVEHRPRSGDQPAQVVRALADLVDQQPVLVDQPLERLAPRRGRARHPGQVAVHRLEHETSAGEVAEESDLSLPTQPRADQIGDLGDHEGRYDERPGVGLEELCAGSVMGIVSVDVRVQRAGIDNQRDLLVLSRWLEPSP